MHSLLVAVLLAGLLIDFGSGAAPPPVARRAVRPITPGARTLLDGATRHSSIVRSLIGGLERTDVIVYVSDAMGGFPDEPSAYLAFRAQAGGTRYLLICIDAAAAAPPAGFVLLAHELQHAREVAGAPEVRDPASLAALYGRIGSKTGEHRYESEAARSISRLVWFEQTGRFR